MKVLVTSRAPLDVPEERVYRVPALELPDPAQRAFDRPAAPDRGDPALRRSGSGGPARLRALRDQRRVGGRALRPPRRSSARPRACRRALQPPLAERAARASRLEARSPQGGAGLRPDRAPVDAARRDRVELRPARPAGSSSSSRASASSSEASRSAARRLVAEQPDLDILEGVESLLRNNLLTTEHAGGDEPRLGMLETIREYALERLAARGDGEAVRRRHAGFYLELAEAAEPGLLRPDSSANGSSDLMQIGTTSALRSTGPWRPARRRSASGSARRSGASGSCGTYEQEGARAAGGAARARLRLGEHPRDGADDDRDPVSSSATTRRRGDCSRRASPVHRRIGNDHMVANTLGLLGMAALTAGEIHSALALSREGSRGGPQGDPVRSWNPPPSGISACASRPSGSSTMPSERSRRRSALHGSLEISRTVGTSAEVARRACDHAG